MGDVVKPHERFWRGLVLLIILAWLVVTPLAVLEAVRAWQLWEKVR